MDTLCFACFRMLLFAESLEWSHCLRLRACVGAHIARSCCVRTPASADPPRTAHTPAPLSPPTRLTPRHTHLAKPAIRRRAVLALAPFDGPEVQAALAAALTDHDWQVRQSAEDVSPQP